MKSVALVFLFAIALAGKYCYPVSVPDLDKGGP